MVLNQKFLLGIHVLTVIELLIMFVFYVYHIVKAKRINEDKKVAWILGVVFASIIVMPVYWYRNIWMENKIMVPS